MVLSRVCQLEVGLANVLANELEDWEGGKLGGQRDGLGFPT
jgi:hypothetical protein